MKTKKTLDLGEYVIKVAYDDATGQLDVEVLDELGDLIESIEVTNSDDSEEEENDDTSINLN